MGKQAVLLIHGIGNQKPMKTLRDFVTQMWCNDDSLHREHAQGAGFWSKPYPLAQNFELRRLTTAENKAGLRTDFFEFYWAHLMHGTKLAHVWSWARSLLWRSPASVPRALRLTYAALWLVVPVALAVSARLAWQAGTGDEPAWWQSWIVGLIVVPLATMVLTDIVGDAARYLHPDPTNVQRRHEIRQAGVQVLKSLHERGYDRIVVVGHSLGTVIAYDLLTYAWAEMSAADPPAKGEVLEAVQALEDLAKRSEGTDTAHETEQSTIADKANGAKTAKPAAIDVAAWQRAQRRLFELQKVHGGSWRVSDFVSLGSPLAHADVLMAQDAGDLRSRIQARELLSCPPALEGTTLGGWPWKGFSYPPAGNQRHLHHAAVFACTRWTNLYFPARVMIVGDLIAGPVAPVFGPGVRDVPVKTTRWLGLLSHTFYWRSHGNDRHVDAVREALDLLDSRSGA